MLQIVDYSERCVAVIGTNKDNMEQRNAMKSMKGNWNPNLKDIGGGWVFSKRKSGEQVAKWVTQYNATHASAPQTPATKPQPAPQPTPQPTPGQTPQAVEQPTQAQTIAPAPATISIPIIEDELEGAPF